MTRLIIYQVYSGGENNMATTIINPAPVNDSSNSSGMGFLLGVIILVVVGFLLIIYTIPIVKQGLSGIGSGGVQITVPKTINVNVQQSK